MKDFRRNHKINQWSLVTLLSIVFCSAFSLAVGATEVSPPLTIITEEWPPFNYSESGQIKGFSTEVVRLIMKELNLKYKIEMLPETRGMKVFDKGPRAMFFSYIMTPERKPNYKWIGPFGDQAIYFYKRKGSKLLIKTLEDAKKVGRVCCRDMGLVFTSLKMAGFRNLDVGVNPESIYLKTIHGRCDLAIGETSWGVAYWLKKSNLAADLLEQTSVKVTSSPLYIATTKDIPDDEIARWQKALDKVKTSNEYAKLYQAYKESSK